MEKNALSAVWDDALAKIESQKGHAENFVVSLSKCAHEIRSSIFSTDSPIHRGSGADVREAEEKRALVQGDSSLEVGRTRGLESLKRLKEAIRCQLEGLRDLEQDLSNTIHNTTSQKHSTTQQELQQEQQNTPPRSKWPLSPEEYKRYGRQLVLPEIGLPGQLRLRSAHVLIVGAGGLGCPAAAYLAGAGVGHIGLVDGDVVEASNLHRQILHSTVKVGMRKVDSAMEYIKALNPLVSTTAHRDPINAQTALSIIDRYQLVLDCTDNPATRYLISDACVLAGKPLVSASALRTDGQLMCLNAPHAPAGDLRGGPCYRCVFPTPPPPETVVSCGEGGILGPVVGVMGVLQALEAIKLIATGRTPLLAQTMDVSEQLPPPDTNPPPPSLLIYSSHSVPAFRHIKLRGRRAGCIACSSTATITRNSLLSGSLDYVQFCGVVAPVNLLSPEERVTAAAYRNHFQRPHSDVFGRQLKLVSQETGMDVRRMDEQVPASNGLARAGFSTKAVLLDVRPKEHFALYSIPESINIPYTEISRWTTNTTVPDRLGARQSRNEKSHNHTAETPAQHFAADDSAIPPIYVLCAQGNESQHTVRKLKALGLDLDGRRYIGDIEGGWAMLKKIDQETGQNTWPEV